jgi:hypothetical protein
LKREPADVENDDDNVDEEFDASNVVNVCQVVVNDVAHCDVVGKQHIYKSLARKID